jgi:hypothetical protein
VTLDSFCHFTYTPDPNFNGTDTFRYQLCDVDGDCDTAIVVIGVTPVDDLPVAVNDTTTTSEDTPVSINVCSNDTASGVAPVHFARAIFDKLELYAPSVTASWFKLYGERDPAGFFELMSV